METMSSPATLAPVGSLVRSNAARFRELVQQGLYSRELQARQLFPMKESDSHRELAASVAWVLERTPTTGLVPSDILARMRQLGIDHRRHGFPPQTYSTFGVLLSEAVREVAADTDIDDSLVDAAARALRSICYSMEASSRTADYSGIPAAQALEVAEVIRHTRTISVIRLISGMPVKYEPGQYFPVTTGYLPGIWRALAPATPTDEYGNVEIHVQALDAGKASPLLVTPRIGDLWTLGTPRGDLALSPERASVLIGIATGLGTVKALIFDAVSRQAGQHVHLIIYANYPGELYDVEIFQALAEHSSWFRLSLAIAHEVNPWWLRTAASTEHDAHIVSDPGEILQQVVSHEEVAEADFVVAGPAGPVDKFLSMASAAGVPDRRIQTQRFVTRDSWPPLS